jgi:chemotaxis protein CheD
MAALVVGVGDCQVTNDPEAVLVTYALGSCIAVVIYDPVSLVGGLLHFMLPESSIDGDKARERPYMFADTGIPLLFQSAYKLGAAKPRMVVAVLGGAQIVSSGDSLNIGKRNHLALRKIFWKAGVMVRHEDVGGTTSRTVRLEVRSGRVILRQGQSETVVCASSRERRSNGL